MKKKLQVFVSSTYTDMLPERQAAVEAILRAGHIPAGMELFAAGDESQLETIRGWINDSDVFMLILGGRYGSLEPKSGKSYIELEYDYATKQKKPLFAAVISDTFLEAKFRAAGSGAMEKINGHLLAAFREKVTKRICRFFDNVDQLKLIVFESLAKIEQTEDLPGWIHGSEVIDPKAALEEISRLREENAELRQELKEFDARVAAVLGASSGTSVAETLSDDAKRLLLAAAASDGHILHARWMGGASIQVGDKNFIDPNNEREAARWKAVLDELEGYRLVESLGSKGESFRVTKRGYDVADKIEGKKRNEPTPPAAETRSTLEGRLDPAFVAAAKREADPTVSQEEMRRILAKMPGTLAQAVSAEREER